MSINKVFILGRLGRDPEVTYMTSGNQITNFNIATEESWTDKSGTKQKKTEWHRIVAFGKLAEICGQYLKKGSQVFVEGKIQTREWEDREGNKRATTEIVIREMKMLGDNKGKQQEQPEPPSPSPSYGGNDDSDIPF